jgi:hypothetical protein
VTRPRPASGGEHILNSSTPASGEKHISYSVEGVSSALRELPASANHSDSISVPVHVLWVGLVLPRVQGGDMLWDFTNEFGPPCTQSGPPGRSRISMYTK